MNPMSELVGEPLSTELVERYLRTRGRRYFRGQHDGEFFFVTNAHPWRLHVHLGISRWHSDMFTIRVVPACFFPAADGARLAQLADAWNQHNREVTAIVHGSSDPQRIGVDARSSQRIRARIRFEDFASFLDRALVAAVDLFAVLAVGELPSTAQPPLRDAS
ncbi:hypothetical protein MHAE_05112 [Mycobacterium haemophilum DSM 44634]